MSRVEIDRKGMNAFKNLLGTAVGDVVEKGFEISQDLCKEDTGLLIESGVKVIDVDNWKFWYGYTAPHAPHVEFGTAPHWAPPLPIYLWVRRQLSKSGQRYNEGDIDFLFALAFGKVRKRLSAAERAFISIYKSIGVNGTEPHPFMRPSLEVIQVEGMEIIKGRLT